MINRSRLNMRTTISIYRQLGKWIESVDAAYATAHPELLVHTSAHSSVSTSSATPNHTPTPQATSDSSPAYLPDPSIDDHFRAGVYLGLGMSHIVLSLMPGKLLALVELFGYKGDRKHGLELLERPGGWGSGNSVVDKGW